MISFPQMSERSPVRAAAREYWNQLSADAAGFEMQDLLKDIADPTWNDINRVEQTLLRRLPPERLIRRAQVIRNRYRDVAGANKYQLYVESKPPSLIEIDNKPPDFKAVLADTIELHQELIREYILGDAIEKQRAHLARRAARIALGGLAILAIVLETKPESVGWQYAIVGALVLLFAFGVFRPFKIGQLAVLVAALTFGGSAMAQQPVTSSGTQTPTTTATAPKTDTATTTSPKTETTTTTAPKTDTTTTMAPNPDTPKKPNADPCEGKRPKPEPTPATTITMVVIAGVLGGVFSLIRRAQQPVGDGDALRSLEKLAAADSQFYLAPITGAIGALVVYAMFAAGLLKGALFPEIMAPNCVPHDPMTFLNFLHETGPATALDHGKVLVWCFIAGFSERLLPDAIDRITSTAAQDKK